MTEARFEALKVLYPSANIMGRAKGIVGPAGIYVGYVMEGKPRTKRFEPGDRIPLMVILVDELKLDVGIPDHVKVVVVSHELFSDFE